MPFNKGVGTSRRWAPTSPKRRVGTRGGDRRSVWAIGRPVRPNPNFAPTGVAPSCIDPAYVGLGAWGCSGGLTGQNFFLVKPIFVIFAQKDAYRRAASGPKKIGEIGPAMAEIRHTATFPLPRAGQIRQGASAASRLDPFSAGEKSLISV